VALRRFTAWPADALGAVALKFLRDVPGMDSGGLRGSLVRLCQAFHTTITDVSAEYLQARGVGWESVGGVLLGVRGGRLEPSLCSQGALQVQQHCVIRTRDFLTFLARCPMTVLSALTQELGRHNYVTPTSYLELINAFKTLLEAKRAQVGGRDQRLEGACESE
jgi:hypothetical protein